MSTYMDIHNGQKGITRDDLMKAHDADVKLEGQSGVRFVKAWADPESSKIFCLSEGPSKEAVRKAHEQAGHAPDEIYEVKLST